jgi:hypothetical protein
MGRTPANIWVFKDNVRVSSSIDALWLSNLGTPSEPPPAGVSIERFDKVDTMDKPIYSYIYNIY